MDKGPSFRPNIKERFERSFGKRLSGMAPSSHPQKPPEVQHEKFEDDHQADSITQPTASHSITQMNITQQMKKLEWENVDKQRMIDDLTSTVSEQQSVIDSIRTGRKEMKQIGQIIEKEQEVTNSLKQQLGETIHKERKERQRSMDLEQQNTGLQEVIADISTKQTHLEDMVDKLTQESVQWQRQVSEKQHDCQDRCSQTDPLENVEAANRALALMQQENKYLSFENVESENELHALRKENVEQHQIIQDLREQRAALQKQVEDTTQQGIEQQKANEGLKQDLTEQQKANEGLQRDLTEARERIDQLSVEVEAMETLKRENTELRDRMRQKVVDLSARLIEQQRCMQQSRSEKAELQQENSQLRREKAELGSELNTLSDRLNYLEKMEADRTPAVGRSPSLQISPRAGAKVEKLSLKTLAHWLQHLSASGIASPSTAAPSSDASTRGMSPCSRDADAGAREGDEDVERSTQPCCHSLPSCWQRQGPQS